jgi:hypothetical protein
MRATRTVFTGARAATALAAAAIAAAFLLAAPLANATVTGQNPCPQSPSDSWMGNSVATKVTFPSLAHPNGITSYKGAILQPAATAAYPGKRPLIAIQHGRNGNACSDWWLAQDLAGHGYTTLVWTADANTDPGQAFVNAVDASKSAITWAGTASNPERARTDASKVTIGGSSMGAIVTSAIQSDPALNIKAGIALDSLRRYLTGDPAAAMSECAGKPAGEVTPAAPVLGFAMDRPCKSRPDYKPPGLKLDGFEFWHTHKVPATSLVMAGFVHNDFASGGSSAQHKLLDHYVRAWLALYVKHDKSAAQRMLARTVDGKPARSLFSAKFDSGMYMPGTIYTRDYRGWLGSHPAG